MQGQAAVMRLQTAGISPDLLECRELDIANLESCQQFATGLVQTFGKLDLLVNNAAIAFKGSTALLIPLFHGAVVTLLILY